MKFLKIILLLLVSIHAFAKSEKISPIPLPQGQFLNIYPQECDIVCIHELMDEERFFSFLAMYDDNLTTKTLQENYLIYGQMFNVFLVDIDTGNIRIAILVPQKTIRRYALTSVNTAISYLLRQSNEFELIVFNSGNEDENVLIDTLNLIRQEGYSHIIAPVTQDGAQIIIGNSEGLKVFIPTLHISLFPQAPTNVIFGGIDYKEQLSALSPYSNEHVVLFSDGSKLGNSLDEMITEKNKIVVAKATFGNVKNNYKAFFNENKHINGSTIYFNTPIVTTSLLASQTRAYKHLPVSMLSTQINYSPMLLTLTQPEDRVNFFIASSIGNIDDELLSINSLFGQDLEYDWVNYATSIGVEYFSVQFFNANYPKIFSEDIFDSQVHYQTRIYKAGKSKFIPQEIIIDTEEDDGNGTKKERDDEDEDNIDQDHHENINIFNFNQKDD